MLCKLVLLVLISLLQPVRLQEQGTDESGMFQSLNDNIVNLNSRILSYIRQSEEFKDEIKESISSLIADLSSLNDSVSNLSMCLQEHKQQTATELAQLQTSLTASIQSSLTAQVRQVNTQFDTKLGLLRVSLYQHNQEMEAELQTSVNTTQSSFETVNSKLDTLKATVAQLCTNHQEPQDNTSNVSCMDTEERNDTDGLFSCGGTGGWRRVVYLNMTDPSSTCPSGWQLTGYSKRTCGRTSVERYTCDSVTFPVSGGGYCRVCGRIKAYQWGAVAAFHDYYFGHATTIDSTYVNGVSVTHGSPRQHMWTFAAGVAEGNPTWIGVCPCDRNNAIGIPPFVGDDYFCESGVNQPWGYNRHLTLHSSDPLWDGENCLSRSTCCSLHNPPYFVKQLPSPTTDDIEARICLTNDITLANIAIELIDLYVQ